MTVGARLPIVIVNWNAREHENEFVEQVTGPLEPARGDEPPARRVPERVKNVEHPVIGESEKVTV